MLLHLVPLIVFVLLLLQAKRAVKDPLLIRLVKGLRLRHLALSLLSLFSMALAGAVLLLPNTLLRWGWWSALGGKGNVIFAQSASTAGSKTGVIFALVIIVLLSITLGHAALNEEIMFREGDEHRTLSERIKRSVVFGLAHLIMGIPIGAALALSSGGFVFSHAYVRQYRRTGSRGLSLIEATRVHLLSNMLVIFIVTLYILSQMAHLWK